MIVLSPSLDNALRIVERVDPDLYRRMRQSQDWALRAGTLPHGVYGVTQTGFDETGRPVVAMSQIDLNHTRDYEASSGLRTPDLWTANVIAHEFAHTRQSAQTQARSYTAERGAYKAGYEFATRAGSSQLRAYNLELLQQYIPS